MIHKALSTGLPKCTSDLNGVALPISMAYRNNKFQMMCLDVLRTQDWAEWPNCLLYRYTLTHCPAKQKLCQNSEVSKVEKVSTNLKSN